MECICYQLKKINFQKVYIIQFNVQCIFGRQQLHSRHLGKYMHRVTKLKSQKILGSARKFQNILENLKLSFYFQFGYSIHTVWAILYGPYCMGHTVWDILIMKPLDHMIWSISIVLVSLETILYSKCLCPLIGQIKFINKINFAGQNYRRKMRFEKMRKMNSNTYHYLFRGMTPIQNYLTKWFKK